MTVPDTRWTVATVTLPVDIDLLTKIGDILADRYGDDVRCVLIDTADGGTALAFTVEAS